MSRRLRATARRAVATIAAALALGAATPAHAAHPLITEDPGTQGTGGVELEIGFATSRGELDGGQSALLAPQLAFGVAPTVDVLVVARYAWLRPKDEPRQQGVGVTSLDAKWRFVETDELQVAVRAGVDLPTGDASRGLGADGVGYHAVLAMSLAWGPASVLANAGYVRTRGASERAHVPFASAAVVWPAEGRLRTFGEVAAVANPDPQRSTWPTVARTGLIWQATEALALDVGFEGRLNHAAPRAIYLAGATLRW